MIIAIDGPAASGKGTLARRLAEHFGLAHLDTGSLYRATALGVLRTGGDPADRDDAVAAIALLPQMDLTDPDLRTAAVGAAASPVAAIADVREALVGFQRDFARTPPPLPDGSPANGAVLDGRDIGTVICPDADVKFFVTADVGTRAMRRHKELLRRGEESIYDAVLQDLQERDHRDKTRSVAPMVAAPDAFVLDTSTLDADAAFAACLSEIARRGFGTQSGANTR